MQSACTWEPSEPVPQRHDTIILLLDNAPTTCGSTDKKKCLETLKLHVLSHSAVQSRLVMCCMERTYDSDSTPAIVSPTPAPAKSERIVSARSHPGSFRVVWSRLESFRVRAVGGHSESSGIGWSRRLPESFRVIGVGVVRSRHSRSLCFLSFILCVNFVYRLLFWRSTRADFGSHRLQPILDDPDSERLKQTAILLHQNNYSEA